MSLSMLPALAWTAFQGLPYSGEPDTADLVEVSTSQTSQQVREQENSSGSQLAISDIPDMRRDKTGWLRFSCTLENFRPELDKTRPQRLHAHWIRTSDIDSSLLVAREAGQCTSDDFGCCPAFIQLDAAAVFLGIAFFGGRRRAGVRHASCEIAGILLLLIKSARRYDPEEWVWRLSVTLFCSRLSLPHSPQDALKLARTMRFSPKS